MVFVKCLAFVLQAVLPFTVAGCVGYLTSLPASEWGSFEYLLAAPLLGLTGLTVFLTFWKMISRLCQS